MSKYENEIKKTLRDILIYIGADTEYAKIAQLQSYLEWLLKNCGVRDV